MARSIADAHIPKGWRYVYLDKVTGRCSGHTPSKSHDNYWNGGVKWISLTDSHRLDKGYVHDTDKKISLLGVENSSAEIHPAGTVVLSRDAGIGKSGVMAEPMAVSQHFIAWKCDNQSQVDSWFLYNWLQYFKPEFERQAVGSTIKTIGLPFFKKLKIALPPITEQRKIAKILSTWDEAITTTEHILANSEQQKKAMMQQLLTGQKRLKPKNGSNFPNWKRDKIGKYLKRYKHTVSATTNLPKFSSSRTGLVPQDRSVINEGEYGVLPLGYFTYRLMSDDLVFKFNVNRLCEKAAISKEYPVFCVEDMDSYFLECHLNYGIELKKFAIQQKRGSTRTRLYFRDLCKLELNIPCFEEQVLISNVLLNADSTIKLVEAKLRILKSEKCALMQQLLTGKRRVKIEEEAEATTA